VASSSIGRQEQACTYRYGDGSGSSSGGGSGSGGNISNGRCFVIVILVFMGYVA